MADYPDAIFAPRTTENLSGVVYDETKLTEVYAEDQNLPNAEIVAIEEVLGTLPQGAFATVKEWLTAITDGAVLLLGRIGGQTVNGGTEAGEELRLSSTLHATKGKILLGDLSVYDEVNKRLGIGTLTPSVPLHMSDGNPVDPALITSDIVLIAYQNLAAGLAVVVASSTNAAHRGVFKATRARGTLEAPIVPNTNDDVLTFLGAIYDGVVAQGTAGVFFRVDGAVSAGVAPQRIAFVTSETTGGARTEKMTIKANGDIGAGITAPSAVFHIKAGTISKVPLKLVSGPLKTTADVGGIEFLTDAFYGTITTAGERKQFAFTSELVAKENNANKATDFSVVNNTLYPSVQATKTYTDGLVAGLLDYRGGYNASVNTYPTSGGSGTAGAVLKGDMWVISVQGTLGGAVIQVGDSIIANVDTPGQSAGNWNTLNTNIAYVPEDQANKSTTLSTDQASNTKYPSVKSVFDWVTGLLVSKANIASPSFTGTVIIPTPFTLGAVSVLPTGTELNFVQGVTSPIQTQLDTKAPKIAPVFTQPDATTAGEKLTKSETGDDPTYSTYVAKVTTTNATVTTLFITTPTWSGATATGGVMTIAYEITVHALTGDLDRNKVFRGTMLYRRAVAGFPDFVIFVADTAPAVSSSGTMAAVTIAGAALNVVDGAIRVTGIAATTFAWHGRFVVHNHYD